MLYVPFVAEKNVKNCNKGTINVLEGQRSMVKDLTFAFFGTLPLMKSCNII